MKIGLLGGSFNPAHDGHLHISKIALKKLGLGQLWWLVSPQNPLKTSDDMMDFALRMDHAGAIVGDHPHIKVLGIEVELNTRYTADTIKKLKQRYPQHEFIWLMGTDNLLQFPRWKKWEEICELAEIHVFDRDKDFHKAMRGKAMMKYKDRIHYHYIRKNPLSATEIRKNLR